MAKNAVIGLVAVGLVGIAAPAQARLCATVWEHRDYNFSGDWWQIQEGTDLGGLAEANWDDKISSIYVEPRCRLTVYASAPRLAASRSYDEGGTAYVGDGWNDTISSLECSCW